MKDTKKLDFLIKMEEMLGDMLGNTSDVICEVQNVTEYYIFHMQRLIEDIRKQIESIEAEIKDNQ